ncbi:MAG: hypothetical protein LBC56_07340 [Oscillospiraceae bacterium]|nr:hypothetical protein [Oscillospiraceae bacterium]
MEDVFVEQLVKKETNAVTALLRVLIVAASVVLGLGLFWISPYLGAFSIVGLAIGAGAFYGGYYLVTSFNVEFEYAVTNGIVDVDKIVHQRKRTRLASFDCKSVEAAGKYKKSEHEGKTYGKVIKACISEEEVSKPWYLTFTSANTSGLALLVFNPDERTLNAIRPKLPRLLQKNVNLWN